MAIEQDTMPQYDERVNEILRGLTEGKNRDELAKEFDHSNYKSIDMYMRRRNFIWSSQKRTYIPKVVPKKGDFSIDSSIAGKVITLMKKDDADTRTIANRLGFKDHHEMAKYMMGKGYIWSGDENNYIKQVGQITVVEDVQKEGVEIDDKPSNKDSNYDDDLSEFVPLLTLLQNNKDKLLDLLTPVAQTGTIPRYIINGVAKAKTVQMIHSLDQLVLDFANEKSMSQRDMFEVALVDFFRKYGYEHEIEQLLRS